MRYWLYQDSRILGPFSRDDLAAMPGVGHDSLVCPATASGDHEEDWQPASRFSDLSGSLTARQAALAPVQEVAALGGFRQESYAALETLGYAGDLVPAVFEDMRLFDPHYGFPGQYDMQAVAEAERDRAERLEARLEALQEQLERQESRQDEILEKLSEKERLIQDKEAQLELVREELRGLGGRLEEAEKRTAAIPPAPPPPEMLARHSPAPSQSPAPPHMRPNAAPEGPQYGVPPGPPLAAPPLPPAMPPAAALPPAPPPAPPVLMPQAAPLPAAAPPRPSAPPMRPQELVSPEPHPVRPVAPPPKPPTTMEPKLPAVEELKSAASLPPPLAFEPPTLEEAQDYLRQHAAAPSGERETASASEDGGPWAAAPPEPASEAPPGPASFLEMASLSDSPPPAGEPPDLAAPPAADLQAPPPAPGGLSLEDEPALEALGPAAGGLKPNTMLLGEAGSVYHPPPAPASPETTPLPVPLGEPGPLPQSAPTPMPAMGQPDIPHTVLQGMGFGQTPTPTPTPLTPPPPAEAFAGGSGLTPPPPAPLTGIAGRTIAARAEAPEPERPSGRKLEFRSKRFLIVLGAAALALLLLLFYFLRDPRQVRRMVEMSPESSDASSGVGNLGAFPAAPSGERRTASASEDGGPGAAAPPAAAPAAPPRPPDQSGDRDFIQDKSVQAMEFVKNYYLGKSHGRMEEWLEYAWVQPGMTPSWSANALGNDLWVVEFFVFEGRTTKQKFQFEVNLARKAIAGLNPPAKSLLTGAAEPAPRRAGSGRRPAGRRGRRAQEPLPAEEDLDGEQTSLSTQFNNPGE